MVHFVPLDSTVRKWWLDVLVFPTCLIAGACMLYFAEPNALQEKRFYLASDDTNTALKEFARLRASCRAKLKRDFPNGIFTIRGNVFYRGLLYSCGEPGTNGKEGQMPGADDWQPTGKGHEYFINIYLRPARVIMN